mgnify:CR=1 FL=1
MRGIRDVSKKCGGVGVDLDWAKKHKRHSFAVAPWGDAGRVSPTQERHGCFCGAFWDEKLWLACGLEISIHTGGTYDWRH